MMPALTQQDLAAQLREVLDQEIAALNLRRSQLGLLREAILQRDDEGVARMLAQLEQAQAVQSQLEGRLEALRESAAEELGLPTRQVTLSALIARLGPAQGRGLDLCRRQIIHLLKALQRQHLELAMLLRECARINRLVLEQILGGGGVMTYRAGGRDDWRDGAGLMDMES